MVYKMEIPKNTKIVIIEGIAGAGKTTLLDILKEKNNQGELHKVA